MLTWIKQFKIKMSKLFDVVRNKKQENLNILEFLSFINKINLGNKLGIIKTFPHKPHPSFSSLKNQTHFLSCLLKPYCSKMEAEKLSNLKDFITQCKADPSVLTHPSLSFFTDYLHRFLILTLLIFDF